VLLNARWSGHFLAWQSVGAEQYIPATARQPTLRLLPVNLTLEKTAFTFSDRHHIRHPTYHGLVA